MTAQYLRVRYDDGVAYFIDDEGNRRDDLDSAWFVTCLQKTIEAPSYLYIGQCHTGDNTGFYKVGYTNDPLRRQNELGVEMKYCFSAASYGRCCARDFETLVHRLYRFAGLQVHGEWFRLTAHDVELLKIILASRQLYVNQTRERLLERRYTYLDNMVSLIESLPTASDWGDGSLIDDLVNEISGNHPFDYISAYYAFSALRHVYMQQGKQHLVDSVFAWRQTLYEEVVNFFSDGQHYQSVAGDRWRLAKAIA